MIVKSFTKKGTSHNITADLSGLWNFTFLPEGKFSELKTDQLQFDSLAAVPGCFDLMPEYFLKRGTGIYQREVYGGGNMELSSEGLGLRGKIFWDNQQIADIDAPFSKRTIRFEAGENGSHSLMIAVNNEFDDSPSSMFRRNYDFYAHGGIYRKMTLASADGVNVDELKILPLEPEKGKVQISVKFIGIAKNADYAEIRFDGGDEAQKLSLQNGAGTGVFTVPNPRLWSPEKPNLHNAEIRIDETAFSTAFGLRRVECREGKLYLNGKTLKLVGCNRHDSHPEFGYAIPEILQLRDLKLLKQAGMNCLRGCHYPQSEQFLDLCDRMGILVWEESLGWGNEESSLINPEFQVRQERETRNMALKSVNHPCVILWGFLNEACTTLESARPLVKSLADILHEVDPTRLVTFGTCRLTKDVCLDLVDVISFNTYPCWYGLGQNQFCDAEEIRKNLSELAEFASKPEYREKPLLISEIGAEAIPGIYGGQRWSEEYQADLLESVVRFVLDSDRCSGTFLWQYCDTRSFISNSSQSCAGGFNFKGLLDRYRNPKIAWRRISQLLHQYKHKENKICRWTCKPEAHNDIRCCERP